MRKKVDNSYIVGLQGKDLYLTGNYRIKEGRDRICTFDYSLESIKMQEVANDKLPRTKAEKLFYVNPNGKLYTDAIVNLKFDYNFCEYNKVKIDNLMFYRYYESTLEFKDIKELYEQGLLDNGVYHGAYDCEIIFSGQATTILEGDLPKGFKVDEDNCIKVTDSSIVTLATAKEIRRKLYRDGFSLTFERKGRKDETIHYQLYKRSTGSARVGTCLAIDKRLFKPLMKWSFMDLDFKKKQVDLAGLLAYLSLTLSSIIDTIDLKAENILVIDDYDSVFETTGMETIDHLQEDGTYRLKTNKITFTQKNSIWDGQSLLDRSEFVKTGYSDKGFLLLRNRMFKSACFNTNIQQFFRENNITDISQLKGFTMAKDVSDIKLITTPSSIKYMKFGKLESWLNQLDSTFGIVKYEKPPKYLEKTHAQTHYQLLNTLDFDKESMKEYLKPSIEYINGLKNDLDFMRFHLKLLDKEVEFNGDESSDNHLMKLICMNDDVVGLPSYKNFKKSVIDAYIRNIKKGHVITEGGYGTLVSCPLEMLYASVGQFDGTSYLDIDEVYMKRFSYDTELLGTRSPHICSGNIWLCKNVNEDKAKVLDKWFNFSEYISVVNTIGNNVMERLNGCDFDSDTVLYTKDKTLINLARRHYDRFLIPTNNVSSSNIKYTNTADERASVDIKCDSPAIGIIVNCSQHINSMIWEALKEGDDDKVEELYTVCCQLAVLSGLAIDGSKRIFNVDVMEELKLIKEKYLKDSQRPQFFKFINQEKGNIIKEEKYRNYETPMDYLISIMDIVGKDRSKYVYKKVEYSDLMNKISTVGVTSRNINSILKFTNQIANKIQTVWNNPSLLGSEKFQLSNEIRNQYLRDMSLYKLDKRHIKSLITRSEKEQNRRDTKLLNDALVKAFPLEYTECFKNKEGGKDYQFEIYHKIFKV